MNLSASGLRTFAVESSVGMSAYAAASLLRARATRDSYRRAVHLLRAWRATEHRFVSGPVSGYLHNVLAPGGRRLTLARNPLLQSFVRSDAARRTRREFAAYDVADRVRMRFPRTGEDEHRQGDLIILKAPDAATDEKGVLLIKYSEAVERLAALFDIERMLQHYVLVVEPSWWGYQDAAFFLLAGADVDVVVQAQAEADYEFLSQNGFGLVPIRIGAGDWIDPDVFSPSTAQRQYDIVMVSSWNPFKRHHDLFAALAELRRRGQVLKTALIGYPNGWTADHIRAALQRHDLSGQCDVYDSVTPAKVADIVSRSRLYVLLSRREGANKAMYEAIFCDTPVLAPSDHRGINHDHLNDRTGMTFRRGALAQTLQVALSRSTEFAPRSWALDHTGFANATRQLNDVLAVVAEDRGRSWTRSIAHKKNQPNLRYAFDHDRLELEPGYTRLEEYLRPVD